MDAIAAKQFLILKVVAEAEFSRVLLSTVERKMLHFTEMQQSLPDVLEVSAEFERNYDSDEYESKIVQLLKNARARDFAQSEQLGIVWHEAISVLKQEDHYLLVMVYCAFPEYRQVTVPAHRMRDYAIYVTIGITLVCICIALAVWRR